MDNGLGKVAAEIATKAAIEWLECHNLKAEPQTLAGCLSDNCKTRLPEALHDAKEALDAGMDKVTEATFKAAMALAGIEAAKEAFTV